MIRSHEELDVYRMAFVTAMQLFEISKAFPREETYALTNQMRRSSRAICSNLAEAWRKRRRGAAFVSKLSNCEAEAAEPRPGSALRKSAPTSPRKLPTSSTRPTTSSSANSSA